MTVGLGKSLAVAKVPQLETGENQLYQWVLRQTVTSEALGMGETGEVQYLSKEQLTDILFDQTYEAVFNAKNMVIASEEKTKSGRSLALAVGAFDRDTSLHLADITQQEPAVLDTAVLENWQVTVADIGVEKLHYHIPEGVAPENLVLYVKDISGNWVQRSFTVEGSYMIFPFSHGESGFALEVMEEKAVPVSTVLIAAGAVCLLAGMLIRKKKTGKKEAVSEK